MNDWLDQRAIDAVGDTEVISTFRLFPDSEPKRIVLVTEWHDDNGPYPPYTQKGFYEIDNKSLTIIWGPDDYPSADADSYRSTWTYYRVLNGG